MKKLLITCTLIVAGLTAYGQGRVTFANPNVAGQLITTNTTAQGGGQGNITGAGSFYFGLYVGASGALSNQLQLNILGTNGGFAGRMAGPSPGAILAPFDGTSPLTFQIRGWSAAGGFSYEAAVLAQAGNPNILTGFSAIGSVSPTPSPATAPNVYGIGAGQVGGFELTAPGVVIPEPSSIALGLLGLGAIALFRRRK